MATACNILSLPVELQSHILNFLPWHDHFLASSVCPLWLSILRTEHFRRCRYYGKSPVMIHRARYALNPNMTYHGDVPRRCMDDDRDGERKLYSHGLIELGVLRLIFQRAGKELDEVQMVVVNTIDEPSQKYDTQVFDIGRSGLLQTDFVFFRPKDTGLPEPGPNLERLRDGTESHFRSEMTPYWAVVFMVLPWTDKSDYEAAAVTNPQGPSIATSDVKIPRLNLRRSTWETKEGTLNNFIGALRGHISMVFFRNPQVKKLRLDIHLRDGSEEEGKVFVVDARVAKEENAPGPMDWVKSLLWKDR
ncbi:hypothetical protein TWF718_007634 [Orbilia javanica]|uniref:F-box domain-containing protein n=1 Tax=Orbilia javanica TaxID=47235 RepID=A0AAN8MZS7_9PEZI